MMYLHFTIGPISGTENLITSVQYNADIFDTYQDISLKNATQTRQKGKKKVSVEYPASEKDIKRLSMKEIICDERTKRNLTMYFIQVELIQVNSNDTNVIALLVDHPANLNLWTTLHNVEC